MGSAHDDELRRPIPKAMIVKVTVSLLVLPVSAYFLGVDLLSVIIGGLVGCAVLAVSFHRPDHGISFPTKVILAAVASQGVGMLTFSNLLGSGPLSMHAPHKRAAANEFQLKTAFSSDVKTMSVILPCANEGIYAVKTARSIGELSPKDVLVEIIVVDDGSTPPLEQFFEEHGKDVLEKYPVKFVRHETFTGLINAKKQGGDRASGDVLTFLDCHVLPRDYGGERTWVDGIMSRIAGNYRRIVVPSITDLDSDKWEEIGRPNGVAKCYLSLDVDFRWFDSEDDFVPIMSGGLLAMSRRWWVETGGYDTGMIGWGGENIDQSLRAWLCHGEIVHARDSHVAHMWRVNHKPQTKAKYIVPEGSVNSNRYRAALAWFDEYIEKVHDYSIFSKFVPPTSAPLPNIDSILEVKNRLHCQPFQWFIERFSKIYFDAAVIPETVFRIRDENTNLCLARRNSGKREEHEVVAVTCSVDDSMQLWHRANRDGDKCCSGLRSYDSMYCLNGPRSGEVVATECNTYGKNNGQLAKITDEGEVHFTNSQTCVSVAASPKDVIVQEPCDTAGRLREFTRKPVNNADGFGNGLSQIVEATTGMCLTAFSPITGDEDAGNIEMAPCSDHTLTQLFNLTESFAAGYYEIRTWENLCLDAADGKRILAYSCYDASARNEKQAFLFDETSRFIKNKYHPTCLSVPDTRVDLAATKLPLAVAGCVTWNGVIKPEQRFEKVPSKKESGAFLLKSGQWCISGGDSGDEVFVAHCPVGHAAETDGMIWYLETPDRLRNKRANRCIDGNDHKTPILYPCYSTENDNQEWTDPMSGGLIKNGRAKMCLDYNAVTERQVSVTSNCNSGARWRMFDPKESTEMRIYRTNKAKALAPVHG